MNVSVILAESKYKRSGFNAAETRDTSIGTRSMFTIPAAVRSGIYASSATDGTLKPLTPSVALDIMTKSTMRNALIDHGALV